MVFRSDGKEIAYEDCGTGLPVVLIHGFPLCRRMWRPQMEALSAAGFRVLTPDLEGFGESSLPEGPVSMSDHGDMLVALLDHLGIEKAVVGGMSMGGYVLLNLLEHHASRLCGAMFLVTRAGADDPAGRQRRLDLVQEVQVGGAAVIAAGFEETLFSPQTLVAGRSLVDEVRGWVLSARPAGLTAGLLAMAERKDYTAELPGFDLPALVLGAENDLAAPLEQSRILAVSLPQARMRIVPVAGHMANLEQPDIFNRYLIEFLKGLG